LIMLPFVIALAVIGLSAISERITSFLPKFSGLGKQTINRILFGGLGLSIICLNVFILNDYILNISRRSDEPTGSAIRYIHTQLKEEPLMVYLFDTEKAEHYRATWGTADWQRLWVNLFIISNKPVGKNFDFNDMLRYRVRIQNEFGSNYFFNRTYMIEDTVYYVVERIQNSPQNFYLVGNYKPDGIYPHGFKNGHNWEIWLNLFTVFKQPFEIISSEQFLAGDYVLPATLFIPDQDWGTLQRQGADQNIFKKNLSVMLINEYGRGRLHCLSDWYPKNGDSNIIKDC